MPRPLRNQPANPLLASIFGGVREPTPTNLCNVHTFLHGVLSGAAFLSPLQFEAECAVCPMCALYRQPAEPLVAVK